MNLVHSTAQRFEQVFCDTLGQADRLWGISLYHLFETTIVYKISHQPRYAAHFHTFEGLIQVASVGLIGSNLYQLGQVCPFQELAPIIVGAIAVSYIGARCIHFVFPTEIPEKPAEAVDSAKWCRLESRVYTQWLFLTRIVLNVALATYFPLYQWHYAARAVMELSSLYNFSKLKWLQLTNNYDVTALKRKQEQALEILRQLAAMARSHVDPHFGGSSSDESDSSGEAPPPRSDLDSSSSDTSNGSGKALSSDEGTSPGGENE